MPSLSIEYLLFSWECNRNSKPIKHMLMRRILLHLYIIKTTNITGINRYSQGVNLLGNLLILKPLY
jgi:hypothetical protein